MCRGAPRAVTRQPGLAAGCVSRADRPMAVRRIWLSAVGAVLLVAAGRHGGGAGVAGAQNCLETDPSYMDACGPTFAVPTWTDAGGWTDPSQYSTIQLADVNGDGKDELLGRSDAGLQIWRFDTSVGQWRPQVDANAVPQILSDFSSPRPGRAAGDGLDQAAVLLDDPGRRHRRAARRGGPRPLRGRDARVQVLAAGRAAAASTAAPGSGSAPAGRSATPRTTATSRCIRRSTSCSPLPASPPVLFARRHSSPGQPSLVFYSWQNGGWTQLSSPEPGRSPASPIRSAGSLPAT